MHLLLLIFITFNSLNASSVKKSYLPIPRFVSIKSSEARLHVGPGMQYPTIFIYLKKNLPVKIIDEYDTWRKIRDSEGTEGWFHKSLLQGKRTVMVIDDECLLYKKPDESSETIAVIKNNIICILKSYSEDWAYIKINNMYGFVHRNKIYGILKSEKNGK